MKYLFLSLCLLMSAHTFACMNKISPQDLQRVIESGDPSQAETLTYKGDDGVCFDGIDLRTAELIDNEVIDFIRKENTLSCASEDECKALEAVHICDKGKVIRTETEVYCAVEMMKKDGKKLVESESKKEAGRAERKAQKDAEDTEKADKQAVKDALKDFACDGNNNVAAAKKCTEDAVKAIYKLLKDLRE